MGNQKLDEIISKGNLASSTPCPPWEAISTGIEVYLQPFASWAEVANKDNELYRTVMQWTTEESYRQRQHELAEEELEAEIDRDRRNSSWDRVVPAITSEQREVWSNLFPWSDYFTTYTISERDWQDELEQHLADPNGEEWYNDMFGDYDNPYFYEPDTAEEREAADRELFYEFEMFEEAYRHGRRRQLTESAIERKKQIARQAYGYKPLDDDEIYWRQEDCPESAPKKRWQLSEKIRWIRKSDKQTDCRRERIFRRGQTASQAIDEQLEIFSERSAPGKVGSNRLSRKLQKKIDSSKSDYYDALSYCNRGTCLFYFEPRAKRLKRRIDRLERLLSIAKAKQRAAKAKKKLSGRESFDEFLEKLRVKEEEKKIIDRTITVLLDIEYDSQPDLAEEPDDLDYYDFRDLDAQLEEEIYPEMYVEDRAM